MYIQNRTIYATDYNRKYTAEQIKAIMLSTGLVAKNSDFKKSEDGTVEYRKDALKICEIGKPIAYKSGTVYVVNSDLSISEVRDIDYAAAELPDAEFSSAKHKIKNITALTYDRKIHGKNNSIQDIKDLISNDIGKYISESGLSRAVLTNIETHNRLLSLSTVIRMAQRIYLNTANIVSIFNKFYYIIDPGTEISNNTHRIYKPNENSSITVKIAGIGELSIQQILEALSDEYKELLLKTLSTDFESTDINAENLIQFSISTEQKLNGDIVLTATFDKRTLEAYKLYQVKRKKQLKAITEQKQEEKQRRLALEEQLKAKAQETSEAVRKEEVFKESAAKRPYGIDLDWFSDGTMFIRDLSIFVVENQKLKEYTIFSYIKRYNTDGKLTYYHNGVKHDIKISEYKQATRDSIENWKIPGVEENIDLDIKSGVREKLRDGMTKEELKQAILKDKARRKKQTDKYKANQADGADINSIKFYNAALNLEGASDEAEREIKRLVFKLYRPTLGKYNDNNTKYPDYIQVSMSLSATLDRQTKIKLCNKYKSNLDHAVLYILNRSKTFDRIGLTMNYFSVSKLITKDDIVVYTLRLKIENPLID